MTGKLPFWAFYIRPHGWPTHWLILGLPTQASGNHMWSSLNVGWECNLEESERNLNVLKTNIKALDFDYFFVFLAVIKSAASAAGRLR